MYPRRRTYSSVLGGSLTLFDLDCTVHVHFVLVCACIWVCRVGACMPTCAFVMYSSLFMLFVWVYMFIHLTCTCLA